MAKTARLFSNGGSQAVRLPAEFRFEGEMVYVRRDARTGDVILSSRPGTAWSEFMAVCTQVGALSQDEAAAFLVERPMNAPDGRRDPFAGWRE